jgi:hypothetical protein
LTAEDAESAAEEGAVWGECRATGGSAQASPPRAAAKLVARVESSRLLFREVNLCHPPGCRSVPGDGAGAGKVGAWLGCGLERARGVTIDEATERKRAVVECRVGCGDFKGSGDRHKHWGAGLVEVGPPAGSHGQGGSITDWKLCHLPLSIINSKTYNAPDGPRLVNGENFDVPQRPFCLTEGPDQAGLDVEGPLGASFRFVNNQFIQPTERRVAYSRWNPVTASPSGYSWQDNKYYSAMPSSNGFQLQRANFQPPDFRSPEPAGFDGVDGWKLATGGASSSDARLASVPAYPDPDRTLATYMEFELGIAPSMLVQDTVTQEFMQLCAQQRRGNWNAALTAGVVNQYMRDGFGLGQYGVELCPP